MILYTHDLWPSVTQFRPAVGEQMRAGLTYREHQQCAHLWAYQFGDTSTIYVGRDVTVTSWSNQLSTNETASDYALAFQAILATENTLNDVYPGRPDLGAYRTGDFLQDVQSFEVRLRGSNAEVRLMIGVDGETPAELLLGTYEDGANTYPSRRFVRLQTGDTENVIAWVAQVRAPDGDGYLEQIEITPCRFGGDAPVDSTATPIATVATMPSGMDYPTLGGDVVIGARDPAVGDILPGPISTGSAIDPWPASDLTYDVSGYTATQWETDSPPFVLQRLDGPSAHVASVTASVASVTYTPNVSPLALGDAWVMSVAVQPEALASAVARDLFRAGDTAIIIDEAAGGAQSILLSEPPSGATSAIASWVDGQWYDLTLAWVPDAASAAALYVWLDGQIVYAADHSDVAGGEMELSGRDFPITRLAWPVLMRAPRSQLGTLSEVLGYVESWIAWRGMMTGIF